MPPKNQSKDSGAPQALAAEDLAVNQIGLNLIDTDKATVIPDTDRVYEITINIPRNKTFKTATEAEQLDAYKALWEYAKEVLPGLVADQYVVEYCQDGFPHIHGYIHFKVCQILTDEYIIEKLVKKIFKHLPRAAWKQIEQNPYNTFYQRFKSPAVVINAKKVVSSTWLDYMHKTKKNAPK